MKNKRYIAQINYFDTNEVLKFTDEEKFLEELKDLIYNEGVFSFSYKIYESEELYKKVVKILMDEFGFDDEDSDY